MFCDNALAFDAVTGRCDLDFDGTDLPLDTTAATPLIISVGCNRRARPDDVLPIGTTDFYVPGSLMARQGWPGDAFDPRGELIGSRFWLLDGAAQTEASRKLGESTVAEGIDWFRTKLGLVPGVKATILQPGVLGVQAVVANSSVVLQAALA